MNIGDWNWYCLSQNNLFYQIIKKNCTLGGSRSKSGSSKFHNSCHGKYVIFAFSEAVPGKTIGSRVDFFTFISFGLPIDENHATNQSLAAFIKIRVKSLIGVSDVQFSSVTYGNLHTTYIRRCMFAIIHDGTNLVSNERAIQARHFDTTMTSLVPLGREFCLLKVRYCWQNFRDQIVKIEGFFTGNVKFKRICAQYDLSYIFKLYCSLR